MSDPDPDEPGGVLCGGGAKPTDTHLASTVHCVDDEIIEWLERRERRKLDRREEHISAIPPEADIGR
jgi:hypothetical protein